MSIEFNTALGKRIKNLRKDRGLSREEAAFQASMSSKFLYEVEHGRRGISAERLVNLAKVLDTSCDYLLLGTADENEGTEGKNQNNKDNPGKQNGFWKQ